MPKSFTDEFRINKKVFENTKALDIILDVDSNYFIDPALLRVCKIPEFIDASKVTEEYFSNIIVLVKHSKTIDDMYWKKADKLLTFKEIKGTCLGYSNQGTNGNAIGKELRKNILKTIKELQKSGEVDPVIFELLNVFQEKVGCDRVSDLLTFILREHIVKYNIRINQELGVAVSEDGLCENPYNQTKVLLLPKQILSPLPITESFDDIDFACSENERVRKEINQYLDLGERTKLTKEEIDYLLKTKISYRNEMISNYKKIIATEYDFDNDPVGEIIWYQISKQKVDDYPLKLVQPHCIEEMQKVVENICRQFKKLVEDNGLWRLLYDENCPKHESAAQLLFFGIADAYCIANNIDLSREVHNGHGPVDFKLSKGAKQKILIEIKLTSNPQLMHGFKKQLPLYMAQENTEKAIYLVIDNGHRKRLDSFQDYYNTLTAEDRKKVKYILIDGNIQESASRA